MTTSYLRVSYKQTGGLKTEYNAAVERIKRAQAGNVQIATEAAVNGMSNYFTHLHLIPQRIVTEQGSMDNVQSNSVLLENVL